MPQICGQLTSRRKAVSSSSALGPTVKHRLNAPREHLETEDHIRSMAKQRRDRMELPAMVFRLVVRFAEQHDLALGEGCEHVVVFFVAFRIDPRACKHAAVGLCVADTKQFEWAC